MSLELFSDALDELTNEIPDEILEGLNGGILLREDAKIHPKAARNDLYIMGEYSQDPVFGRTVYIYYGSFAAVYGFQPDDFVKDACRKVLRHELTHHIESLAGDHSLELEDAVRLGEYLREKH